MNETKRLCPYCSKEIKLALNCECSMPDVTHDKVNEKFNDWIKKTTKEFPSDFDGFAAGYCVRKHEENKTLEKALRFLADKHQYFIEHIFPNHRKKGCQCDDCRLADFIAGRSSY